MIFDKKVKEKEIYGWELTIERLLRQVFEVYSGAPVRVEYLTIKPVLGYCAADLERNVTLRNALVTGRVVGTELEKGVSHEFELGIELLKARRGSYWEPTWNRFNLHLRKPEAAHWTRYCATFDHSPVSRGEQIVPTVRVHRVWADEGGEKFTLRDTCYYVGSHLGDRRAVARTQEQASGLHDLFG